MDEIISQEGYFNSQPHKEADSCFLLKGAEQNYFNSQPHKEADRTGRVLVGNLPISTHSLTRRLT